MAPGRSGLTQSASKTTTDEATSAKNGINRNEHSVVENRQPSLKYGLQGGACCYVTWQRPTRCDCGGSSNWRFVAFRNVPVVIEEQLQLMNGECRCLYKTMIRSWCVFYMPCVGSYYNGAAGMQRTAGEVEPRT